MRRVPELFDEFAATLQFPDYFGENWNAFYECLVDLSWLPADGYILVIRDASECLKDEDVSEFQHVISLFARTAATWSSPVAEGKAWDRPGKPFHVVLHGIGVDAQKLVEQVEHAGERVAEISR